MEISDLEEQIGQELENLEDSSDDQYHTLREYIEVFDIMAKSNNRIYSPLLPRRMEEQDTELPKSDLRSVKRALDSLDYVEGNYICTISQEEAELYKKQIRTYNESSGEFINSEMVDQPQPRAATDKEDVQIDEEDIPNLGGPYKQ